MDSDDVGKLAEGLAAVGIAALGANPVVAAALGAAVSLLRARWDRHAATRELQRQVTEAITAWASSEHLDEELIAGLTIATAAVSEHGLNEREFKELDYDADRATEEVIRRARQLDRDWANSSSAAEDAGHTIARRAILATMNGLVTRRHQIESTVLKVLREESDSLRHELHRLAADTTEIVTQTQALVHDLTTAASAADLMIYLQHRIEAWNFSPWLPDGRRPSDLERRLQVSIRGEDRHELTTDQAIRKYPHLVVLGGPGAGKSWLALRMVRKAAQHALDQLARGEAPTDIRIPIFTTWDVWASQSAGGTRQTLTEAAFDARLGPDDLGGLAIGRRIKRLLGESSNVLVVIDSLDEARDRTATAERVAAVESIAGWRTVITSRPGAWDAKSATRARSRGVAELQPLTWDDDIKPFIQTWFSADRERAVALIGRLDSDLRLREAATVPLFLTFYCIHARTAPPTSPLPRTRFDLYEWVIEQLLAGDWTRGERPERTNEAKGLLVEWAWHAVEHAVTPAGLGNWGETFEPPNHPPVDLERAVDHVAPTIVGSTGMRRRRFRHRTLLEHLVAKHITGLSPAKAAKVLLPHLWFDPDWAVTASVAIANHPQRNKLLSVLGRQARGCASSNGISETHEELHTLFLDIASESEPDLWTPEHQREFHQVRTKRSFVSPEEIIRSSHWQESNRPILDALLTTVSDTPHSGLWQRSDTIKLLAALTRATSDRRHTLKVIRSALTTAPAAITSNLIEIMLELNNTTSNRKEILDAALGGAVIAAGPIATRLVGALPALVDNTEAERHRALEATRTVFSETTDPLDLPSLVDALLALGATAEDRRMALNKLLSLLPTVIPFTASYIAAPIPSLATSPDEQRQTFNAISTLDRQKIPHLIDILLLLDSSEDRRDTYNIAFSILMSTTDPRIVRDLAEVLIALGVTDSHRCAASDKHSPTRAKYVHDSISRKASYMLESTSEPREVGLLVDVLLALGPDSGELHRSLAKVLGILSQSIGDSRHLNRLIDKLPPLASTSSERKYAAKTILAALNTGGATRNVEHLTRALLVLHADPRERSQAVSAIAKAIDAAPSDDVPRMSDLLIRLQAEPKWRARSLDAIIKLLPADENGTTARLIEQLPALASTDEQRQRALRATIASLSREDAQITFCAIEASLKLNADVHIKRLILDHSLVMITGTTNSELVLYLTNALYSLNPTLDDRTILRAHLLTVLNAADPWAVAPLVKALRTTSSAQQWLQWLRTNT